jgi:TMEM175 potassium channel family protein
VPRSRAHATETEIDAHRSSPPPGDDPTLARLGAFGDGVYAFAVTLMVLSIRVPRPTDADAGAGLLHLLTAQWRSGLAYVLSFLLLGMNWANHRVMFAAFARADHILVWLDLLYLMVGVAFIPIPTAVLGAWLGHGHHDAAVAAVFYGASTTAGGLAFVALWWYGAYRAGLAAPALTAAERRVHSLAWGPAPLVTAALTALAFVAPLPAVAGYLAVVVAYALPAPELVARRLRRRRDRTPHPR